MAGRIVAVVSSPRNGGFGDRLAQAAAEGARESGKEVEVIRLNDLRSVRHCQNCLGCRGNGGHCVLDDDITPILEKVRGCEGLIVSCQLNFARIDGLFKMFEDRFYSFMTDSSTVLEKGKKLLTIVTAGADDRNVETESAELEKMMSQYFLFDPVGRITYITCLLPADEDFMDDSPDRARELGRLLRLKYVHACAYAI